MPELSHVGMTQCFYCGEAKDILLDNRIRNTLPRRAVYDMEPCRQCEEYMQQGVILLGAEASSCDRIPQQQKEYQDRLDRMSPRQRKKALPFIPLVTRTGHFMVVRDDWVRRCLAVETAEHVLKCRWTFVDREIAEQMSAEQKQLEQETGL